MIDTLSFYERMTAAGMDGPVAEALATELYAKAVQEERARIARELERFRASQTMALKLAGLMVVVICVFIAMVRAAR